LPTKEELEVWYEVTRTVRSNARLHALPVTETPTLPRSFAHSDAPASPLPDLRIGQLAPARKLTTAHLNPSLPDNLARAPLQMDAKTHTKMVRGRLDPQARIDLHGMTVAEAHAELIGFLLSARASGLRLVLVITGKGKSQDDRGPIPSRLGAIRHQMPHWLRLPPLSGIVQQLSQSHARHGGGGAFYLYLRKPGRYGVTSTPAP
jgi:DNA-nicking Smr family endonuclease